MKKVKIEIEVYYMSVQVTERRKKLGLTQQELSEKLDISRASVSNMETGRHDISLEMLEKLCEIFSCSSTDLLGF
ncbi:helix-turn-helix transcriptional regulator [Empedobacter brevis]